MKHGSFNIWSVQSGGWELGAEAVGGWRQVLWRAEVDLPAGVEISYKYVVFQARPFPLRVG